MLFRSLGEAAPPFSITTQPQSRSVPWHTNVNFNVVCTGVPPFAYQWHFGQTNLLDATNSSLILSNVGVSAVGSYRVVISNVQGVITSAVAQLTVNLPAVFTAEPQDVTAAEGETAMFNFAAQGVPTVTWRWLFNGQTIVGNGATSANSLSNTLTRLNVTTNMAGGYSVTLSNAGGYVTSRVATLTVLGEGGLTAPYITLEPLNRFVPVGGTTNLVAGIDGSPSPTLQWQHGGMNIPGATTPMLVISNAQFSDGGTYRCVGSNVAGQVATRYASLTVMDPPLFTLHPQDVNTNAAATLTFTSAAAGSQPMLFQWRLSPQVYSIGGGSNLTLANIMLGQAGDYYAVASNAVGMATSQVAHLTVFLDGAHTPARLFADNYSGTNGLYLTIALELGKNYRIQSSTNLMDWADFTNFLSSAQSMSFLDASATNQNQIFYRVISP